jgi:Ca2+-binding RTX toxin-like protein
MPTTFDSVAPIDTNQLINGLDIFLTSLETTLKSDFFNLSLPLIGDNLKNSTDSALKFLENIKTPLQTGLQLSNPTPDNLKLALTNVFGNLLANDIGVDVSNPNDIKFNLNLRQLGTQNTFNPSLANNLGLPGLSVNIDGLAKVELGYDLNLDFGFNQANGFYIDTANPDELKLNMKVSTPFDTTTQLGLIKVKMLDKGTVFNGTFNIDVNTPGNHLIPSQVSPRNLPSFSTTKFTGNTDIKWKAEASVNGWSFLPSASTDINISWGARKAQDTSQTSSLFDYLPTISVNNVDVQAGSFINNLINPIFSRIQSAIIPSKVEDKNLIGSGADDTLFGDNGNDKIDGQEGNDYLYGKQGNDTLIGGAGDDFLFGGKDNDSLLGGMGNDVLSGNNSNDILFGDQGNDTLYGGKDNDSLIGGIGNDFLSGDQGDDTLIGVDPTASNPGLGEVDTLLGGQGRDRVILGDKNKVYYDNPDATSGANDYALILGFNPNEDRIQLSGKASDYQVISIPSELPNSMGIFHKTNGQNELIALVDSLSPLSLDSKSFIFV